jgi:hypothetical protein
MLVYLCLVSPNVYAKCSIELLVLLTCMLCLVVPNVFELMGSTQRDSFADSHKGNRFAGSHSGSLCVDAPARDFFCEEQLFRFLVCEGSQQPQEVVVLSCTLSEVFGYVVVVCGCLIEFWIVAPQCCMPGHRTHTVPAYSNIVVCCTACSG